MRVLVTGANGFIGSNLAKALLAKGYLVNAMVRTTSDLRSLEGLEIDLAYGDILNPASIKAAVKNCELLFHVAGVFSYWGYDNEELVNNAQNGIRNIIEAAHQSGVKRVILTSSSVTFGATKNKRIIKENQKGNLDNEPTYVIAKSKQVQLAFELAKFYNIDLVSVHPTLTVGGTDYGLTESNRVIANYIKDDYKTTWIGGCNIVDVQDVVSGHILAAEKGKKGEQYILGSQNLEWSKVHSIISELVGLPGPYITAYHTSAFLASAFHELTSLFTGKPPSSSLQQAKMVGRYYWYSHDKAAKLGYQPKPSINALIAALSWLVASQYIPASTRATMELSSKIYNYRNEI